MCRGNFDLGDNCMTNRTHWKC